MAERFPRLLREHIVFGLVIAALAVAVLLVYGVDCTPGGRG